MQSERIILTLCILVLGSCKDSKGSLVIQPSEAPQKAERTLPEQADASPDSQGALIYSKRILEISLGTPIEPLLATPGFSHFRTEPLLPEGLSIDQTTGSITGTALAPSEARVYRISAERAGQSETTEVQLTVYALPGTPPPPRALKDATNQEELSFQWTAQESELLGARIVAYNVQIAKPSNDDNGATVISTQSTKDTQVTVPVIGEGHYLARIQSIDALGNRSSFSTYSTRVLVDHSVPTPAVIQQAFVLLEGSPLSVSVTLQWLPGSDGLGSLAKDLEYTACIATSSQALETLSACEASSVPFPLTSVTGVSSLRVPPVPFSSVGSGSLYSRLITKDQVGYKSISSIFSIQVTAPAGNPND